MIRSKSKSTIKITIKITIEITIKIESVWGGRHHFVTPSLQHSGTPALRHSTTPNCSLLEQAVVPGLGTDGVVNDEFIAFDDHGLVDIDPPPCSGPGSMSTSPWSSKAMNSSFTTPSVPSPGTTACSSREQFGVVECRSAGVPECWSDGVTK